MPRPEDIEQFKRVLASYGAGTAERSGPGAAGATAPASTETEAEGAEPADELADLAEPVAAAPGGTDEGAPPDIGDLLSSLGGDLAGGPSAAPTEGDENLDLSALFGEEEAPTPDARAEPGAPSRRGRQKPKKEKPPRTPKRPKERPIRHAEREYPPEEEAALDELAASATELSPAERLPDTLDSPEPAEELIAPAEDLAAAMDEFAIPDELPAPEELPTPTEEPAAPAEDLTAPAEDLAAAMDEFAIPDELPARDELPTPTEEPAEPVEELTAPADEFAIPEEPRLPGEVSPPPARAAASEEPAELLPEFLEPAETAAEAEPVEGATAEEALLKPFEAVDENPSLTGDLEQFSVLPDEAAPEVAEPAGVGAPGPEPAPAAEPDLASFEAEEPGVTPSDLPDIGGLDELTLPEEGTPAPTPRRTDRAAARPAPRAEPPRRGPLHRAARPARARPARVEPEEPTGAGEAAAAAEMPVGEIQLTDEQFDRLRRTLGILPRNLKIAVQDIVAGAAAPTADLAALIGLLVTGAGPTEIAALATKITGKRIRIPAAYERRTGLAFEREQRTFAYAFRQNILPLVRLFVLAVVGAGLVGFLGYRFVWQPLSATANYRRGYEQLKAGRFAVANERFTRASDAWPMRRWYYRYAEGFTERREYGLAAEKYEDLLVRWPDDRKAVLDWAALESQYRMRFATADEILHRILDRRPTDYDALLAAGDNFLEWATQGEAREAAGRYEDARLSWAELMKAHGQNDEVLFRMLRYFVRTDDLAEAERLRALFFDRRRLRVDVEAARSLAELGGYLVDKRQRDWVRDILLKAAEGAPELPAVPYQFARFYRAMEQQPLEEQALESALALMDRGTGRQTLSDVEMRIDARTLLGELYYEQQRYLDASRELGEAVALVEKQVRSGVIDASMWRDRPKLRQLLGRPYAKLADVSYYIEGDLATAADLYRTAAGYGYRGPEIEYKLGYISYAAGDWRAALERFGVAEEGLAQAAFAAPGDEAVGTRVASSPGKAPINLLYAQGNAFYRRGDLFAAQGSWLRVLDAVDTRLAAIGELQPLTRPDHRALLEYRMRANNNLGVATALLAGRTGDRRRTSAALAYLAAAAEAADVLARAPETLVASEAKSLPALNMRGVLYPLADFELQIYKTIPKDLEATSF